MSNPMTKKPTIFALGTQYDLNNAEDVNKVMDAIDNAKKRNALGDLSMIAYGLLIAIVEWGDE